MLCDATEADIPELVMLIQRTFAEYEGQLEPPSSAHTQTAERIRRELGDGGALIALDGGRPVGCVFYHARGDHLYFDRLAVLPEARGHGLGRMLVAAVEQRARQQGIGRVRLSVRLALPKNLAFYEQLGYRTHSYGTHPGYSAPTFVTLERVLI